MGKYFKDAKIRTSSVLKFNQSDVDALVYSNIKTASLASSLKSLGKSVLDLPVGLIKKLLPHTIGTGPSKIGGGALNYATGSGFHPMKDILELLPTRGLTKSMDKLATFESLLPGPIKNRLDKPINLVREVQQAIPDSAAPGGYRLVTISQPEQRTVRELLEYMRVKGSGQLPDNLQWERGSASELVRDINWLDDAAAKWARTKLLVGAGAIAGGSGMANVMRSGIPELGIPESEGIIDADKYLDEINQEETHSPNGPASYSQELTSDPLSKYR